MSIASFLSKDTATVQRPVIGKDSAGGVTRSTWSTVASGIPVRISSPSGSQQAAFAQLQVTVSHVVYTQSLAPKNGDRFLTSGGKYLRIVGQSIRQGFGTIPGYSSFPCEEVVQ